MSNKLDKIIFMAKKLKKDLSRGALIYDLADCVHSEELKEYYFVMDENDLKAGMSQNFHFDENDIPMIPSYIDVREKRLIYYPISIGQFGLAIFHTFLKTNSRKDKARFLNIANWFYDNRINDDKLGDYWLADVAKPEFRIFNPWPSAFAQSRGISILLRAFQLTGENKYFNVATNALKIFDVPSDQNGVTTFTKYGPAYEEYPAPFPTLVLDGFIFSLFGLYDYVRVERGNLQAKALFDKGVTTLKDILPQYDLGFWIKYNLCSQPFYPQIDPASITYFRLVNSQLRLIYRITDNSAFVKIADKWKNYDRFINVLRMYWLKYQALRKLNRL
jgi:hypothetical protein